MKIKLNLLAKDSGDSASRIVEVTGMCNLHAEQVAAPERLLAIAVEGLLNSECGFWACEGYEKKPVGMMTCHRCDALYHIFKARPDLKQPRSATRQP